MAGMNFQILSSTTANSL
ncbi:hypothetical protein [Robinsoniella peoriensis]